LRGGRKGKQLVIEADDKAMAKEFHCERELRESWSALYDTRA